MTLVGPDGSPLASSLVTAQSDRLQDMKTALAHYEGTVRGPLLKRVGESDDNLIISLGRLIVDKGVSFLFGQQVQSQIGEDDASPASQDWLEECWRRNKRPLTLAKWATNGGIYGHAFLRLLEIPGQPFPRIVVLDPSTLDVVTDPDDIDDVWRYTITPPPQILDPDDPQAQPVRRRTLIQNQHQAAGYRVANAPESWTIYDQEYRGGAWTTLQETPWPYPFAPIVHCQNLPKPNDFWGESDLPKDVQAILGGVHGVASRMNKILRIHAHPKVWTRGMGARTIDTAIDSVIHLPSETAELKILEMQSDLTASLNFLNKLLNLLTMMVRIPMVALGEPDNLGAISGVALQIRYQPLIEKTATKRETYGDALVELERRLLFMGRFGEQVIPTLHWREMLPADPLMERQVWVIDEELGLVSKETLSDKAEYNFDEEQKRIADEQQAERDANTAAGLNPDGSVPAPTPVTASAGGVAPLQPQKPDQAKNARST